MDNKQLPTSSCTNEQNEEVYVAGAQNFINGDGLEQKCAQLERNNCFLIEKLYKVSIINKKSKQHNAELKQRNAALEKQLNAQAKTILELKNKEQQRHSQQEDNFHQQNTPPQIQSYHVLSPKNTQQREEITCKHTDLQGQPEQQLEPNNTTVQYMAQKVRKDTQASPQKYHTVPANSNMAVNTAEVTRPRITNSMERRKSGALRKQPHEKVLDEGVEKDIISEVTRRSGVSEEEVRNTISSFCAEEEIRRNANCATIAHGDRIDNDGRLEIGMAEKGNNLGLLCSAAARDMAIYFPDTEQNCSQEGVGPTTFKGDCPRYKTAPNP